jgi:hypothetical protein
VYVEVFEVFVVCGVKRAVRKWGVLMGHDRGGRKGAHARAASQSMAAAGR